MLVKQMIIKYIITLLAQLKIIHSGGVVLQIQGAAKLGFLISIPAFVLEKLNHWTIQNYDYILIVLCAIAIDHLLGTIKHLFWDYDFSIKKNIKGLAIKISLVLLIGFLFEGLNVLVKHDLAVKDYLITVSRLMVFLYPAASAFGNSAVISGGKFPPQDWINWLNKYQKNIKIKSEIKNNDESI